MADDRFLGGLVLIGSIAGIAVYFWLLFMSPWSWLTIQVSAFVAVGMILFIVAWVGYTLATAPSPMPIEDLGSEPDDEIKLDTSETEAENN